MILSSLGSASVGVPSSVLWPMRAFGSTGGSFVTIVVEPVVTPSVVAVAVMIADPTIFAEITPVVGLTATIDGSDVDHVTSELPTGRPCPSTPPWLRKSCVWKPIGSGAVRGCTTMVPCGGGGGGGVAALHALNV